MGIIKRQSFKTTIINYVGVTIGVVFLNFVFPHLIEPEYLGLVGLIQGLVIIFSSFTTLGTPHLLVRFGTLWPQRKLNGYHTFAFVIILLGTLLCSWIYSILKPNILDFYKEDSILLGQYYYLLIPLVFFSSLYQYFELYSLIKLRLAVPSFLREIVLRVVLILSLFLIYYQIISYQNFNWIFLLMYLIPFLGIIIYNFFIHDFKLGRISDYFTIQTTHQREELSYTLFMFLLLIANNLIVFVDCLMIPAFLGLSQLAIYLRPQVLGNLVNIPYRAVAVISSPVFRNHIIQNEMEDLKKLYISVALNLFIFGSMLALAVLCNVNFFFQLLPDSYSEAKGVLFGIALARLFDMAFGLNSELLTQSKYFKQNVYFSLISMVIGIAMNLILIPKLGILGAAFGLLSSLIFFNLIKTWFIKKHFGFHCFSKGYITILLIALCILLFFQFIPGISFLSHHHFLNAIFNIGFRGILAISLYTAAIYTFKVSNDFNHLVQTVLSGKILRGGHKMSEL